MVGFFGENGVKGYLKDIFNDMKVEAVPNLVGSIGATLGYLIYTGLTGQTVSSLEVGLASGVGYFIPNLYRDIRANWSQISNGKTLLSALVENAYSSIIAGVLGYLASSYIMSPMTEAANMQEVVQQTFKQIGEAVLSTALATYGTTLIRTIVEEPLTWTLVGVSKIVNYFSSTRHSLHN